MSSATAPDKQLESYGIARRIMNFSCKPLRCNDCYLHFGGGICIKSLLTRSGTVLAGGTNTGGNIR